MGNDAESAASWPQLRALWPRAIVHIDMECFFVAVELLDRPDLVGKPVVVGGAGNRGVVASASYEARSFGVRSAMAMSKARRLCPNAVILPGNMTKYSAMSKRIMDVFRDYTPHVEPLSLDEAFCDVTSSMRLFGSPRSIGRSIRQRIADDLSLSCSVGVASNKSLAKLASEAAKPSASRTGPIAGRGVVVVAPGREREFLDRLSVGALFGIGPKTRAKLGSIGIDTVPQLREADERLLVRTLGAASARQLQLLSQGVDDRPVVADQAPKSVSNEVTFAVDRSAGDELDASLLALVDSVFWRSRNAGLHGRTLTLKIRFDDFETISRSRSVPEGVLDEGSALSLAKSLMSDAVGGRAVRLIGFGISGFSQKEAASEQLSFELASAGTTELPSARSDAGHDGRQTERQRTDRARTGREGSWTDAAAGPAAAVLPADADVRRMVHEIRQRFGRDAVVPARLASSVGAGTMSGDKPGPLGSADGRSARPWGPDDDRASDS